MKKFLLILFVLTILLPNISYSQSDMTAKEIMDKANNIYYYGADDGKANIKMTITDLRGRERVREFVTLRKDVTDGGDQKYYVYFKKPSDVEGMVFMVNKKAALNEDDERFLYIPAVDLVKRISAKDKRTSFAGSHFTYEDVSGRSTLEDTFELIDVVKIDGKEAYHIKATPKNKDSVEFSYYEAYIDKKTYIPLKAKLYDKGGSLYKELTVLEIKEIQNIPTVTKARIVDMEKGETVMEVTGIEYNIGLKDNIFTDRYLRKAPRKWIK